MSQNPQILCSRVGNRMAGEAAELRRPFHLWASKRGGVEFESLPAPQKGLELLGHLTVLRRKHNWKGVFEVNSGASRTGGNHVSIMVPGADAQAMEGDRHWAGG
jgi:hypothetical protein